MYTRPSHRPRSDEDVLQIIRDNAFATLVTSSPEGMIASHLPFVFENGMLYAHMARANQQSATLGNGEALVIFAGPHAYISPSWYADPRTAPTWDYIAVHCYGTPRVHDDGEARKNIERLIAAVDTAWTMSQLAEEDVQRMIRNVVSFEIPVSRMEAKFKLNQGETRERNLAAAARLEEQGDGVLAAYMRRYNDL